MPTSSPTDDLTRDVRAGDYDRFLCIQVALPEKRASLYAVTAFHGELARIAETVSEPLLGHIRLAWWREAIEEIAAGLAPRNHPVVQALAVAGAQTPGIFAQLAPMIDARAMDLDESLMADEADWQHYLDATAGNLHFAWALILAPQTAIAQETEIRREARAYAMVGLVRAIPYMAGQGFLRFPHARIERFGLRSLEPGDALTAFISSLLDEAEALLKTSQSIEKLPPIFAFSCLARLHMKRIKQLKYKIFLIKKSRIRAVLRIIQVKLLLC